MSDERSPEHFRFWVDAAFDDAEPRIRQRIGDAIAEGERSVVAAVDLVTPAPHCPPYVSPGNDVVGGRGQSRVLLGLCGVAVLAAGVALALALAARSGGSDRLERLSQAVSLGESESAAARSKTVYTYVDPSGARLETQVVVEPGNPATITLEGATIAPPDHSPAVVNASAPFANFTADQLMSLPTDPERLSLIVAEHVGLPVGAQQTAGGLATLGALAQVPSDVRSAAIRALGDAGGRVVDAEPGPPAPPGAVVAGPGWTVVLNEKRGLVTAFGWTSQHGGLVDSWVVFDSATGG